jgi:hypothetical protein
MTESVDNAETETPNNTPFYQENGRRIWARPFKYHAWNRDIFRQQVDTPEEKALGRGLINEDLIRVLIHRLGILNSELPNAANNLAIAYLQKALKVLESRSLTRDQSSAWLQAAFVDAGNEPGRNWLKACSEVKDNVDK